ncbi:hypothetical protein EV183_004270 [Coemansia sp. RSA 2336]|nr:hypothetical protein EV183_004270 [Coemansia sp. RSA 2336]
MFASKDKRVNLSIDGQISDTLLQLLFGGDDDDTSHNVQTEPYQAKLKEAVCAMSIGGEYMALAYRERFILLEGGGEKACQLVSISNDVAAPGETVTSLYCIDIYASQQQQKQAAESICVIAGYSSGYMRVFSARGHLLTAHRFHPQKLQSIRMRMPLQVNAESSDYEIAYVDSTGAVEDNEEVNLTYQDGVMVSIDGRSLYLALRLCLNEAAGDDSDGPTFQYKKWAFDLSSPRISDAASYGPAVCRDPLAVLAKSSSSSQSPDATARFLVAPYHGDAAFGVFITSEDAQMSFSAVDIAGKVAAKVTGAVLSIAKSYLWRSNSSSAYQTGSEHSGQSTPGGTEAGAVVPCALAVHDYPRKVLNISLAPASYGLAALTDSLGRVMLFDLENCEVVHMLKGLRGSQCAWLELATDGQKPRMFVVVYVAKRGILEIHAVEGAEQPLASINIGSGWKLVQCPTQPLGGSFVVGSVGHERRAALPAPASCVLVDGSGRIARIHMDL